AHQKKTLRTVVEVSDRALEVAANDQEAIESYYYKLQALRFLQDLGEQQVEDEFEKTVAAALSDERENVVALGMKFRVESGFAKWSVWDDEQKSELIKSISSFVTS